MFGAIDKGEQASIDFFNKWQEKVISTVPPEKLLIHHAKDGYEPLCKFLGLPVPDEKYPRMNDTKEQLERMAGLKRMAYCVVFGLPVIISTASYYLINYFF